MLYTTFKVLRSTGRTDYDKMIEEVRDVTFNKNKKDLEVNLAIFNSKYGFTGKGLDNLNKTFKDLTGADALGSDGSKSLGDFYTIFKSKYLLADGNMPSALDATQRQLGRIHGADVFSPVAGELDQTFGDLFNPNVDRPQYRRYPPTRMLAPLNQTQIQNQLQEQLVMTSERNDSLFLPKEYMGIKDASDAEKMSINLGLPGVQSWMPELGRPDAALNVTQNIPGVADQIKGRIFLQDTSLTEQNNVGMPVYEVWMQDEFGRKYPIYDKASPVNNTMLFIPRTAEQFAPEWASADKNEKIDAAMEQYLVDESRKLYSRFEWNYGIKDIQHNYKQRQAYRKNLENIEHMERQAKKVFGERALEKDKKSSTEIDVSRKVPKK